jgi:alanine racemase
MRVSGNETASVLINGKVCNLDGNICMDMCFADVTDTDAKEGDEVIVFGRQISLSEFARKCETIPYEILTSISQRVKRIYLEE